MHNLFAKYAEEWKLKSDDIEAAAQLFTKDYGKKRKRGTPTPSKLLLFLYAKRILAEERFENYRTNTFKALLEAETDNRKKALERLTTIVEKGESTPPRSTSEVASMFDAFVVQHPEWNTSNSFVVFRDHPDLKGKSHALVERFQKNGLCYMHACVVVQHYLVAMNNDTEVPMLNMAEYLKKYMPGDSLYEHIWNNKGGDSFIFLKNILKKRPGRKSIVTLSDSVLAETELDGLLRLYGPGLVSGFHVAENFASPEWQHVGEYNVEKFEGRHAMVLVGYRIVDGKKRYLLQNWWKTKPYVEVDVDYLLSSDAIIHFIKEKQIEMGDYPTNLEALVECESGIDCSENFVPEGVFSS